MLLLRLLLTNSNEYSNYFYNYCVVLFKFEQFINITRVLYSRRDIGDDEIIQYTVPVLNLKRSQPSRLQNDLHGPRTPAWAPTKPNARFCWLFSLTN